MSKVARNYGIERNFGEVIYNPQTKVVLANIQLGMFGKFSFTLKKDNQYGGFDLLKPYKDRQGNEQVVKLGKLFPAKNKQGEIVEGINKGALSLLRQYDKKLEKEINNSNDCLIITTHKLKKEEPMGNSGWIKLGYITGQFGIEKPSQETSQDTQQNVYEGEINDGEEIPF